MTKTPWTIALIAAVVSVWLLSPAQASRGGRAVPTTLYFHGSTPSGEVDSAGGLIDLTTFMVMDPVPPTESQSRSKGYVWSNYQCAGNRLHPVWVGDVSGKIVGDIKLTFTSASAPQSIDVRVWPDLFAQACNADYRKPAADVTVEVPAGHGVVEVDIPSKGFVAYRGLMIQLSPTSVGTDTPGLGRMFYDSTEAESRIEFKCIPQRGSSCTG